MKTKLILAVAALVTIAGVSSQTFASTFICKQDIGDSKVRRIIIGGSVFMVCESPADVDLGPTNMKNKYCAASNLLVSGQSSSGSEGSISGTTYNPVINNLKEGVSVQFSYSKTSGGAVGNLVLSDGELCKSPEITLPLQTTNLQCVIK